MNPCLLVMLLATCVGRANWVVVCADNCFFEALLLVTRALGIAPEWDDLANAGELRSWLRMPLTVRRNGLARCCRA